MRFCNYRHRLLLPALLLAAVIPSCKSPTAPLASPTLTLILPDSARAFDTVVFRAHYSDPIQTSWKFSWQFGDSSHATIKDTSITHVYDSAGTYLAQTTLEDSANKTIARQTGQLRVLPLNGPTLTLNVPDSVFWGDSCMMSISSSQTLLPTWKYTWSFGDTTTFSSQQDSALHWYLNPGMYTVRAELDDTARHIPLGSRTAIVKVVARHFDLALLQSMNHLDLTWLTPIRSDTITDGYGYLECEPYVYPVTFGPFAWNGKGFTMHDSSASGSTSGPIYDTSSETTLISANVDPEKTQLADFAQDINSFASGGGSRPGNTFCTTSYQSSLSLGAIPFISQSDTDMVFEAIGNISHGSFNSSSSDRQNGLQVTINSQASWSESSALPFAPYVRIRFHK